MILSAELLDKFDRCTKRYAYEVTHEPITVSPLGLLYAGVEGSLTASDPCQGAKDAIAEMTQRLDVKAGDLSPLSAVKHVECMGEVVGLALRDRLGQTSRVQPCSVGEHEWHSNLFVCRGTYHRIILTSHIDDDSLRSFAHSWQTIGELAALERSMTLTVVIIGSQRGGRRHSPWSKGFRHPVQRNIRFSPRKKDSGFTANWKTEWREQTEVPAKTWMDQMVSDGVMDELIVSRRVNYRADDSRMIAARREMLEIAVAMEATTDPSREPMRRSSCDPIGKPSCEFQAVCYSSIPMTPDDFPHLYRARETPLVELKAEMSIARSGGRRP